MSANIRVVVYEPGKPGRELHVPNTVGMLQALVSGFFDVVYDSVAGVFVYYSEQGFSLGLEHNRQFGSYQLIGTAVLTQHDDRGNAIGLADDDVARIRAIYG